MPENTQVARPFTAEATLKRALRNHLRMLGFAKNSEGELVLPEGGKEIVKNLHRSQRRERLAAAQRFLDYALAKNLKHFASGEDIDPQRRVQQHQPDRPCNASLTSNRRSPSARASRCV